MLSKLVKNPFFYGAVIAFFVITFASRAFRKMPPPPEVISHIPAYTLTNQDGQSFGSENLKGKTYIVNFFFTSCTTVCPLLMQKMNEIHKRYVMSKADISIVSITVDPEVDTPEVLKAYAQKNNFDLQQWHLLTGKKEEVRSLIESGFQLHLGVKEAIGESSFYEIAHSLKVGIIDGEGGLRGFYSTDPEGLEEIFHRSIHVLTYMGQTR